MRQSLSDAVAIANACRPAAVHVQNRESSQRFRDRAKERSNAIQERMKWLEDRVKYLELELEATRSGVPLPASAASASAITAPDPMPAASIRAAEEKKEQAAAENAGLNVLRRENESLRRSFKAAEEVVRCLRDLLRLAILERRDAATDTAGCFLIHAMLPIRSRT